MFRRAVPQAERLLRVGLVRDGKVVEDRLIQPGEKVTLGRGRGCTFQVDDRLLPKRLTLFTPRGEHADLHVGEGMSARVGGAVEAIDARPGQVVPLTATSRGKLHIGAWVVLFQYVPAPLTPMSGPANFRPRLIEDEDGVFFGFLGVFTAFAAASVALVVNTVIPEVLDVAAADERVIEYVRALPAPEVEAVVQDAPATPREERRAAREDRQAQRDLKRAQAAAARLTEPAEDPFQSSTMLAAILGTRGDPNRAGSVPDLFSSQDTVGAELASSLQNVQTASADPSAPALRGPGGRGDSRFTGIIGKSGPGGSVATVAGPRAKVQTQKPTGLPEGAASPTSGTVGRWNAAVQACYEAELKGDPTLAGRFVLDLSVDNGVVVGVDVRENETGSHSLESCVRTRAVSWRFDAGFEAELTIPFVLSASH